MHLIKTDLRQFSAAHRLVKGYEGKCSHLHGHDYRVNLVIGGTALNDLDLLVDFDDIKTLCNDWVQGHLDHGTLVCEGDVELHHFVLAQSQKHYVLPGGRNATAEALAEHLFATFNLLWKENSDKLNPTSFVHSVEVWESDKSGAIFCKDGALLRGDLCGA